MSPFELFSAGLHVTSGALCAGTLYACTLIVLLGVIGAVTR